MAEIAALVTTLAATAAEALPEAATVASAASAATPIATALSVGGTVLGGIAAKNQGNAAAASMKRQATQEQAIASRNVEEQQRKTALVESGIVANAAASGAGINNPTIFDILSETAQRGDYLARNITAGGVNQADSLSDQANAARARGESMFAGSLLDAGAKGIGGVYDYYNPRARRPTYG